MIKTEKNIIHEITELVEGDENKLKVLDLVEELVGKVWKYDKT